MKTKKILLPDQMIPVQWYNIVADMPQKPNGNFIRPVF